VKRYVLDVLVLIAAAVVVYYSLSFSPKAQIPTAVGPPVVDMTGVQEVSHQTVE
jgi:hypothetical protein